MGLQIEMMPMATIDKSIVDILKAEYPKRGGAQGWPAVKRLVDKHLKNGVTEQELIDGTRRYADWCEVTGKIGTELVKMAQTFYGRDMWWQEEYPTPKIARKLTYAEQLAADLKAKEK